MLREFGITCVPMKGKAPALHSWTELQSRLPTTRELLQWFGPNAPEHNIGAVCGKVSGIVVVDCDSTDAITWWYDQDHATPLVVRTGGGGFHYYYRRPETDQVIRNRQKIGDRALDLKADNGLVVAAGSVHPNTGKRYSYVTPIDEIDLKLVPVFDPAWLPKRKQFRPKNWNAAPTDDCHLSRVRNYIRKIRAISGEGGHNRTYRVACFLRDEGLSPDQALNELRAWSEECAEPPWTQRELEHKVNSVFQ
ncbi:bifunctional DNA primase/polymerase [Pirellulales bacterium]|nr:bifunctional DNA primase/polymerase [Pirellulales bacterium]